MKRKKKDAQATIYAGLVPPLTTTKKQPASTREDTKSILTTTQWLNVISIFVSIIRIYHKREYIKNVFTRKVEPKVEMPPTEMSRQQPKKPSVIWIELLLNE